MGILDEAIKEHLELKRQHGADDSELKQLEDEAFGPPERPGAEGQDAAPDPLAEAPTEFMAEPDLDQAKPADSPPRREMPDIQEAPAPPPEPQADAEPDEQPAEEAQPAAEHEAVTTPPSSSGHNTEERHAIADQPTEMYDVEEELAAASAPAPPDEDLVAEEKAEPRLGPAEPLPSADDERDEELEDEDEFWDEKRLSDELDQALEAPAAEEPEPISEEHTQVREPISEEQPVAERREKDEDVLDDTPEFLEGHPEDEQLWFEQKPPKDFDFDD